MNETKNPKAEQTIKGRPFLGFLVDMDESGTVSIPDHVYKIAGIDAGTQVEVLGTSDGVLVRTTTRRCNMCNVNANTKKIGSFEFCERCYKSLTGKGWDEDEYDINKPAPKDEYDADAPAPKEEPKNDATIVEVTRNV
ncbi:AbrB/MazE/SpoVT family DNA-binding domain-containing protein [Bacillus thuringiensis]|nr:AbrB/MazE/SpoVT family DNA-binding domain-containing protein [Bacillus thuringiensis]MED2829713.1 AbrB/MazE/SpoVT family DNA-binding domain-containing protein [Bacillus thuringiensis]MED2856336.1 AbrB/MazE/SpoVT family DNA-binding domain-containing protein [Bacillus thuringiensis]MED2863860.1 AbrB/MazE/SpoVT family DNA-binding domain-containing protein [Bacillus thuringiensis]